MGQVYIFDVACVNCVIGIQGCAHKNMHAIAGANTIGLYTRR